VPAAKYKKIIKICPRCNVEFKSFDGGQNAREFCSKSCAMKSRKNSEENKKNISNTVLKWFKENNTNPDYICKYDIPIKNCLHCNLPFSLYNKRMIFCSQSCSSKHRIHSEESKKKRSISMMLRIEQGISSGWRPRNGPSYPETIVAVILDKLNIKYICEHPAKRWLIDFADIDRKIALEIDGKQHDRPKRKESDRNKDRYLIENGWSVFRIRWQKLSADFYESLEKQIVNIFKVKE